MKFRLKPHGLNFLKDIYSVGVSVGALGSTTGPTGTVGSSGCVGSSGIVESSGCVGPSGIVGSSGFVGPGVGSTDVFKSSEVVLSSVLFV